MTEQGDTLRYSCPRCHAKLTTRREYAGRQVKCPRCEGVVKVPASAAMDEQSAASTSASVAEAVSAQGVVSLSITCPQCKSILTATTDQIGQEIICSECLEGVVVTAPQATPPPPPPHTLTPAPEPPQFSTVEHSACTAVGATCRNGRSPRFGATD